MFNNRSGSRYSRTGKQIRLARIFRASTRRALVVPMDHSVTIGPLGKADHAERTAAMLAAAGADAIVVHKGRARAIDPVLFTDISLIVHLSAGTDLALDRTGKVLVGTVADAVELGADAVSVHVNIGSLTEASQLSDLGRVATECERWGLPLLAMMYARGPESGQRAEMVDTLAHLAAIATDLGADIVKLGYAGSPEAMNEVVDSCPLPILVAGGAPAADDERAIAFGREVADSRVAGLSFGRLIFDAAEPRRVATDLAEALHAANSPGSRQLSAALESA